MVTHQKGVEISVKQDSGRLFAITQAADVEFRVGDRVRAVGHACRTDITECDNRSSFRKQNVTAD